MSHPAGRLTQRLERGDQAIGLYGLVPPKVTTSPERHEAIAARWVERLRSIGPDGCIVYDIQDESSRTAAQRPFPYLETLDPRSWAQRIASGAGVEAIVYRSIARDDADTLRTWLTSLGRDGLAVLVGAPSSTAPTRLTLDEAYRVAQHARASGGPALGGIAIAERHHRREDEQLRLIAKTVAGCRFFVTQAVFDVSMAKSLVSDYALALQARGETARPLLFTFTPCGSEQTLALLQWLGIHLPRWLVNDLRHGPDSLGLSLALAERIYAELADYAAARGVPVGFNVESVAIRREEIDASLALFERLRRRAAAG